MSVRVKNYFTAMGKDNVKRHGSAPWTTIEIRRDFIWTMAKMLARARNGEEWIEYV